MLSIASGERDSENPQRKTLVGLAAPQVGLLNRIIVVDEAAVLGRPNFEPRLRAFVNPRIVDSSDDEELGREGCYSTGEICAIVSRAKRVKVLALDRHGEEVVVEAEPPLSRIFQHEVDHLDGVRAPDRIRSAAHLHRVRPDEFGAWRTEWPTWKKRASLASWVRMKSEEE
jgi:peptide deformylase